MLWRNQRWTQNVVKPESNSTCSYILSTVPGAFYGCDSHSPGKGPGRTESGAKRWDQFEDQTWSEGFYNIILHFFCASLTLLGCPKSAESCMKSIVLFNFVSPLYSSPTNTFCFHSLESQGHRSHYNIAEMKHKCSQGLSGFTQRHLNIQEKSTLDEHTSYLYPCLATN